MPGATINVCCEIASACIISAQLVASTING
jgi:hypothetical protein